jgi:TRAP-type transport system periplasmic protein
VSKSKEETMTMKLSRRLVVGAAVATPAILTFGRGSFAQAQTTLSLGHGAAPTNPRHIAAEKFAEVVKDKSGGRITIRVAPSDQLGNEASLLTSLRTGAVDMCVNSQGSSSALVPEIAALGLPFLFDTPGAAFKLLDGPFGNVIGERFAKVGILPLGFWDNGIRHVTNSKRAINTPEDLKGLKLRTPPDPMTIDIFQSVGAATQQIAFGELYVALQQGVVDGQENPLEVIEGQKFNEVQKYVIETGHVIGAMTWIFSEQRFKSLPPDVQKVLLEEGNATMLVATDRMVTLEGEIKKRLEGKGMQFVKVDTGPFREKLTPMTKDFPELAAWVQKIQAVK